MTDMLEQPAEVAASVMQPVMQESTPVGMAEDWACAPMAATRTTKEASLALKNMVKVVEYVRKQRQTKSKAA